MREKKDLHSFLTICRLKSGENMEKAGFAVQNADYKNISLFPKKLSSLDNISW